jgi:hypothetical protein
MQIAQQMYALENVEPATHTFTHPFFWKKIVNNSLDKKYRLKPKNYTFSLENELSGTLEFIEKNLHPTHKAQTVFWSGDCAPRENALGYAAKHNILNINGGDTVITQIAPWLSEIAPLGLQRGEYTQVYTGAQNENVFTHNWLGPFWGFKRVVQTFKLTNSPRRFKPIDIYYHLYSGSKQASLKALEFVFDWAIKQDVMPIFTSEYIPKVMDFYTVSMANEGSSWLVEGMRDLKTLRIEQEDAGADLKNSPTLLGVKHFQTHTYLSLDTNTQHRVDVTDTMQRDTPYLISANAKVREYKHSELQKEFHFKGNVPLKLEFYLPKECHFILSPQEENSSDMEGRYSVAFSKTREATLLLECEKAVLSVESKGN